MENQKRLGEGSMKDSSQQDNSFPVNQKLVTAFSAFKTNKAYWVIAFVDLAHVVAGIVQILPPRASIRNILTLWFSFAMVNATVPLLKNKNQDLWKYWIIGSLSVVIDWYIARHLYINQNFDYGMLMVYFLLFPILIAGFTLNSNQFSWIAVINLVIVFILYFGTQSTELAFEKWAGQHVISMIILAGVSYVFYNRLEAGERDRRENQALKRELALIQQRLADLQQQDVYERSLRILGEDAQQVREELYQLREEIPRLVENLSQDMGKVAISLIVGTVITAPTPNRTGTAMRMVVLSKNGGKYRLRADNEIMPFDLAQGAEIAAICEMRSYHSKGADLINHNVLRFISSAKFDIYRQISEIISSEI